MHPLVIAGMNRFRMMFSIGSNKLFMSGIVIMKLLNLFLTLFANAEYGAWSWISATVDNMHS